MAINFPDSPATNDNFTDATGKTWKFSGTAWVPTLALTSAAVTQALGYTPFNAAGGTFTGNIRTLTQVETRVVPVITAGVLTIDCSLATIFDVTLNANITSISFTNVPSLTNGFIAITLILTNDGTARTVTWGSSIKFAANTPPVLTGTSGKVDVITLVSEDNVTWYAFVSGLNL